VKNEEELVCTLCGEKVRWALGLRRNRRTGKTNDERHLIRADNGLHPSVCKLSVEKDPVHHTGPVMDVQGDVWERRADGLWWTPETKPFPLEYVLRKWGPLRPVTT